MNVVIFQTLAGTRIKTPRTQVRNQADVTWQDDLPSDDGFVQRILDSFTQRAQERKDYEFMVINGSTASTQRLELPLEGLSRFPHSRSVGIELSLQLSMY